MNGQQLSLLFKLGVHPRRFIGHKINQADEFNRYTVVGNVGETIFRIGIGEFCSCLHVNGFYVEKSCNRDHSYVSIEVDLEEDFNEEN